MEKIKYNLNQKPIISQRKTSSNLSFKRKGSSFDKEKQILFNHKSSLEALLYMIKNIQLEYLLKLNIKKQRIKQILIILIDKLNLMLQEKNKIFNHVKMKNEKSKKKLQNILFPCSKDLKKIEYILQNSNYFNNNNIKTNSTNIIFEKNQLELLNFQINNEIEKTNFLIEQKIQMSSFLKSYPIFLEVIQKIYCNNKNENINKVSELLKEIVTNVRKDFINIVKEKMEKESEIKEISFQIENIKDIIEDYKLKGCKKYIETKDIIPEDLKECIETTIITSQSKRNSIISNNTKNNQNNQKQRKIKDKDILDKNKNYLLDKNKITKDIFNDKNNNKVNNYLNMNINVHININNNNYIHKFYLDKNTTKEEKEQYEMELNEKNKIIITPIITYENKNTGSNINDDSFELNEE